MVGWRPRVVLVVAAVVWVDEGIGEGEEEEEDARAGERTGEVIRGRADGDADVEEEDMDCGVRDVEMFWVEPRRPTEPGCFTR